MHTARNTVIPVSIKITWIIPAIQKHKQGRYITFRADLAPGTGRFRTAVSGMIYIGIILHMQIRWFQVIQKTDLITTNRFGTGRYGRI